MSKANHIPPTPYTREVMQHESMCQSLMGTSSLVHRDWFFHATKVMRQMDEEIRQLRRTVNRLDEQTGRPPRYER